MMASEFIIEVSESDFEFQVLAYSQEAPVIVDFWAEWCVPCKTLSPLLERLTREAGGAFRLAKVNVDLNPNLAARYNVRSIPAVKAFRDGKVVSEFVGLQPEPRLREFIALIAPSPADLILEKGLSLLGMGEWKRAEAAFREVLENIPASTAALLGLAKSLLAQGQAEEALHILRAFPPSREYSLAESLRPVAEAFIRQKMADSYPDDPQEAAYHRALKLFGRGNLEAALDGLLDILREDKRYRDGEVRQVVLGIFELMGDSNPLTRQYRQELASVLF
jgi:putative thioredoxin